ncbi:hypothetical protein [Bacillus sp. AFS041924]|uniref:hypothetical protein n=1 Tax=Bacillus sp. AFS041924 TaxID=2033503 RepID=UPI000BFD4728|nr:hypothetical protein [Bacillus sp. AFS041924]PGS52581.1 hypothetical protein COC46_08970 [Bacillus sp. AFS041924]
MKKYIIVSFLFLFAVSNLIASPASAYSYGNPNEEQLAEVYKDMLVKLDKNPPDYTSAKKLFGTLQKEIEMHMGPDSTKTIIGNLDNKDKEATIDNMNKLLVLNIARRLENIEKNFKDYETSKKLLAKGYATYDALSPIVEAKNPTTHNELKAEFDNALKALGNPGLFGVGKKEPDQKAFSKSKDKILSTLQKEFKLKSLEVGHFSESVTESTVKKKEWTDISNLRNWIPIVLIVGVMTLVVMFAIRKNRKK